MEIDEEKNRVSGNRDPQEHVASIFNDVIPRMCKKDVTIDVIGMGDGGPIVAEYLKANWNTWKGQVRAAAIGSGPMWQGEKLGEGEFKKFWEEVSFFESYHYWRGFQHGFPNAVKTLGSTLEHTFSPMSLWGLR